MSEAGKKSWDDGVDALRGVVNDLRGAVGRDATPNAEEEAAAARLKEDVARLEQSAANLRTKLTAGFDTQREEFETALDRERAEQTASQLRSALDELVALARTVLHDITSAAQSGFKESEPEVKSAIRSLEDVAGSAGAWVKALIDPDRTTRQEQSSGSKPPLDEL